MRPVPLLDIGSPSTPASAPSWREVRRRVIAEQEGKCPGCGLRPKRKSDGAPALDVITLPGGHYVGLCRRDRLLHDGPARAQKARRTRLFGAVQTSLLRKTKARPRRQHGPLTIEELRAEALGSVSPSASAAAGIEAVLGVLARRGILSSGGG